MVKGHVRPTSQVPHDEMNHMLRGRVCCQVRLHQGMRHMQLCMNAVALVLLSALRYGGPCFAVTYQKKAGSAIEDKAHCSQSRAHQSRNTVKHGPQN
jgi:hypothetical protein